MKSNYKDVKITLNLLGLKEISQGKTEGSLGRSSNLIGEGELELLNNRKVHWIALTRAGSQLLGSRKQY